LSSPTIHKQDFHTNIGFHKIQSAANSALGGSLGYCAAIFPGNLLASTFFKQIDASMFLVPVHAVRGPRFVNTWLQSALSNASICPEGGIHLELLQIGQRNRPALREACVEDLPIATARNGSNSGILRRSEPAGFDRLHSPIREAPFRAVAMGPKSSTHASRSAGAIALPDLKQFKVMPPSDNGWRC